MNCPYCDLFTPSTQKCVHCGEKLASDPSSKRSRSVILTSRNGFVIKILFVFLGALVIYNNKGVNSLYLIF
jgi:hypothetical protein